MVKLADASAVARIDEAVQANAGFQTVLIRLTHKTPKEAAEAVKLVLGKSGAGVAELPGTSLLLVSDLGPRIEQVETILRLVDVPGPAVSLTEIRVEAMPAPGRRVAMVQQLSARSARRSTAASFSARSSPPPPAMPCTSWPPNTN